MEPMTIVIAVIVVGVIGLLCAVMLTIASKFMAVEVDERIPRVRECLPGANCGACGFAGCDGYAAALVGGPGPVAGGAPAGAGNPPARGQRRGPGGPPPALTSQAPTGLSRRGVRPAALLRDSPVTLQ